MTVSTDLRQEEFEEKIRDLFPEHKRSTLTRLEMVEAIETMQKKAQRWDNIRPKVS